MQQRLKTQNSLAIEVSNVTQHIFTYSFKSNKMPYRYKNCLLLSVQAIEIVEVMCLKCLP